MKKIIVAGLVAFSALTGPLTPVFADTTDDVIRTAKKQVGTPYSWGGTSPNGFDCSGFLLYAYGQNGISLPRTAADMYKVGTKVSRSSLKLGDMVFFETYKPGASHAGIYIGDNKFIHSGSSRGVEISSLTNSYWKPRYIGAKRLIKEAVKQEIPTVTTPVAENAPVKEVEQQKPVENEANVASHGEFKDVSKENFAYEAIKDFANRSIINGYENGMFKPNDAISREQAAVIITAMLGLNSANNSVPFHDISSDRWSAIAINTSYENGIFNGDENGLFHPTALLTRAQFAAIVQRIYDLSEEDEEEEVKEFNDVPPTFWAHNPIQSTYENGLFKGYEDNTFRPMNKTTRAQFIAVLKRSENMNID